MRPYRFSTDTVARLLEQHFGRSADLALVPIRIGSGQGMLCYLKTMTNAGFLTENVTKPLLQAHRQGNFPPDGLGLDALREFLFGGLVTLLLGDPQSLSALLSQGYAGLLLDGEPNMLIIDVKELEKRPIGEPTTQNVIKGPKEAFTESADTNMSLIRRRIINERLRFEKFVVGSQTKTPVYLTFMEGEADERVLRDIRDFLQDNSMVSLFDSGSLEQLFRSKRTLLFPAVYHSERPDSICSCLLDKRVGLIVNGSPFVLIVPALFADFFKSPEDEYQWSVIGSLIRSLRYLAFMLSLSLSALYVAVTCYHQELIPTLLLTSIAAQRTGIPFPAVVEMFLMEITFELLREAGTRMPRLVGQSISIAGALVLGEAAVQAGIVSNITVIVVALTAIAGFVSPVYSFGANIRLFRYVLIILGSLFGLFGVIVGIAFLAVQLTQIETFGIPYFSPMSRLGRRRSS
ncbi:spore germination protein [Cohnella hashimotonis]|uniref:Spore germination protein n=1 Tax=Cohnella hashimotonis TaxID=2826895 RepID=A0ABT6THI9_9BACL|nr:spore germination protein [Cohnella hashimotonis]MDI4646311.1 spore germination protein [Cohnella hashimotonis]